MSEDWTKEWERRTVNGVYPLRRFLGRSNHSVVFLTDCKAQNIAQAAIKILPANPALTEAQLAHWRSLATLSHPHLIRLLDSGRCQLGGHNFLFVVMDHAEQTLAQILPSRPLTAEEVTDLLPATLDALAYLHGKDLVHGGLKPPNFLVVNDQLKLASDTIRPAGERTASTASTAKPSVYDPPEAARGAGSAAADLWGLGITLVEALTQTPPAWSQEPSESVSLPGNLPPQFVDTVQRCLNRDPGQRPTIAELLAQSKKVPPATSSPAPPAMVQASVQNLPIQNSSKTLAWTIAFCVIVLCAVWTAVHLFRNHMRVSPTPPPAITPASSAAVSPAPAVEVLQATIAAPLSPIIHQEIPSISRRARESIRGDIKIAVRVTVNRSGNVIVATLESRGSSKYFARAALDAAKKWKFVPAADQASRVWILHFDLTRADITSQAAAER
jgi:TonB family protein